VGFAWALLVPPAEVPDEPLHVAYVQSLVERGQRPALHSDDPHADVFSTEQKLAREHSNYEAAIHEPSVRPEWRASEFDAWRAEQRRLPESARQDGGEANAAAGNPPLYYAWEAVAYGATAGADLFTRWYAMRLWSVLLLGVAVTATWLLAGELAGGDRLAQLAAAGFVGLQPGATAISGGINPDGAMIALWALVIWLGVRLLRRGPTRGGALALVAATLGALLTKATSFGLLPAVGLALGVSAYRALRGRRPSGWTLAAAGVAAAGVVGLIVASGAADRLKRALSGGGDVSLRGFLSYLWQAYLPNLPFQTPVRNLAAFWGYDVWIRSAWGNFGWSELLLPGAAYAAIAAGCAVVLGGAALALIRRRFAIDGLSLAYLAVLAGVLVLGLHWAEYRQFLDIHLSLIQGRYLLPALPIGGLAVAAALANLRPPRRPAAATLLLMALFALQLFSLGVVVGRFYA
jgi:4-amino-4-deoxy-L-arabinose transferase-like glycosyltransferase